MEAARVRYELRVGTVVSPATLASFRVPVTPTAVPRKTVYRFLVPADRDLTEVVHRLIERGVELLEVRRCSAPRRRREGPVEAQPTCPGAADADVLHLRRVTDALPEGTGPAPFVPARRPRGRFTEGSGSAG